MRQAAGQRGASTDQGAAVFLKRGAELGCYQAHAQPIGSPPGSPHAHCSSMPGSELGWGGPASAVSSVHSLLHGSAEIKSEQTCYDQHFGSFGLYNSKRIH